MSLMVHLPRCDGVWHLTEIQRPTSFFITKIRYWPSFWRCAGQVDAFFWGGGIWWNICRCKFVLCVISVYKVTKRRSLDILLAVVFSSNCVEQFKGLNACVPLRHPVHLSGALRVFFFFSFFFALLCAAVWQVNGAQHQTPSVTYSLTSFTYLLKGCSADIIFELLATPIPVCLISMMLICRNDCVFMIIWNDFIIRWTKMYSWKSKEMICHLPECLSVGCFLHRFLTLLCGR